ncbi:MAG: aconitate hydratase, partial [Firmicutes bacterium]|nr:aconitate hydratase [Bacillota bacterium]
MGKHLIEKIISAHIVAGEMMPGNEIQVSVDQTLTQDVLGTMAYLQFEALGGGKVKTKSVSYIDHNTIQDGFENADDHRYLQTVADKHGIKCSKPGNGICHQIHVERFSRPGEILIGGDSHTPTCGAVGMVAFGVGGLEIAAGMAGGKCFMTYPKVVRINLEGTLQPWVSAKDIALEVLKMFTTKGNVGVAVEYGGSFIKQLTVPERATITNMGAEMGVTTSIFPSDEVTREFFKAQ